VRKDDRRCIDCGRTRDQHFLAMVQAKCPSGEVWGLYDPDPQTPEHPMSDQAVKAMEAALAKLDTLNRCARDGVMRCPSCAEAVDQTRAILTDAILAEREKE
jgi:hypothetical protein